MPLRLHLTAADLMAIRFAPSVAPLLELALALARLQASDPLFAGWRARMRTRMSADARPMLTLAPASGAGPTFLDPISDGLEDGIEAVASAPAPLVHAELRRVFGSAPVSPWVRDLDRRDRDAWALLSAALGQAYASVIGPERQRLDAAHRSELSLRGRMLAEQGLRATLAGLFRGSTWDGATLTLPSPADRDEGLGGRGLTLQPSAFWTGSPLTCDHPDGSLLLVYPSATPVPVLAAEPHGDALSALLGETRAAVLRSAGAARTTTEVARDVGISTASASEHTKVLRAAGLVSTVRDGRAVVHALTPLGAELVKADSAAHG